MLLGVGLLVSAARAQASRSASVGVSALVGIPATVTAVADLAFGNVTPGIAKTVAPGDATAGRFTAQFQTGKHVNITFTLPAYLTGPASSQLPIGSWTGLWNRQNRTNGATAFTPSASATTIANGPNGTSYVFIGATVTPSLGQRGGTYTGTVTLTGLYAGF